MMPVRLNCPYCNAGQTVDELPETGRVTCPRCNESYPAAAHIDPDWTGDNEMSIAEPQQSHGRKWLGISLVIILFSVCGLTLWLFPGNKFPPTQPDGPPPSTVTMPPKAIVGLKVLPGDAAILAAIQPARLQAFTDNAPSLPGFANDWQIEPLLAKIANLGIDLNHVNSVVIAVMLSDDSIIPNLFVVLDLSMPLADEEEFLNAVTTGQFRARSGATYYKAFLWNFPMTLRKVDEKTYYFATRIEDLDVLPRADLAHLAKGVRESLDQLSPASIAWAVTDYRNWQEQPSVKALRRLQNNPKLFEEWKDIRALALSLSFEPEPSATVAVRGLDANAAERFENLLVEKLVDREPLINREGDWAKARLTMPRDKK